MLHLLRVDASRFKEAAEMDHGVQVRFNEFHAGKGSAAVDGLCSELEDYV